MVKKELKYEEFLKKCSEVEEKLQKLLPDIDRHDLHLIVRNILMPEKWGRRFFLKRRGGRYVP